MSAPQANVSAPQATVSAPQARVAALRARQEPESIDDYVRPDEDSVP